MRCVECGELLPLYVGGELGANLRDEVKVHVGSCPDCTAELEELQRAWNSFASAPLPAVRADFVTSVLEKTLEQRKSPAVPRWRSVLSTLSGALSSGRRRVVVAGALSLALVSVVAALTLGVFSQRFVLLDLRVTPVEAWEQTTDAMRKVKSAHFVGLHVHHFKNRTTHIQGRFKYPGKFRWDVGDFYGYPERIQNILFGSTNPAEQTVQKSGTVVQGSWLGYYHGQPARVVMRSWFEYYRGQPARVLEFFVPQETYEMRWWLYTHPTSHLVMGLRYQRVNKRTGRHVEELTLSQVRYNVKLSDELFTPKRSPTRAGRNTNTSPVGGQE